MRLARLRHKVGLAIFHFLEKKYMVENPLAPHTQQPPRRPTYQQT